MSRVVRLVLCGCLAGMVVPRASAIQNGKTESVDSGGSEGSGVVYVRMSTTLGDFTIELNAEKAPKTVANFLSYVDEGFYKGTMFHRILDGFMIQGGGMTEDYAQKETHAPIRNEADNGLKNEKYTIAMARSGDPHSATSQFFINVVDNAFLNHRNKQQAWGYCVFGKVVDGFETINKIAKTPVHKDPRADRSKPAAADTPVIIKDVRRLDASESAKMAAKAAALAAEAAERARQAKERLFAEAKQLVASKGGDVSKGVLKPNGLWVLHVKDGEGAKPTLDNTIKFHYTGWLVNGSKFDSSRDRGRPLTFALRNLIEGWKQALPEVKEGGKVFLIIPPELGYGKAARTGIPANSTLVFEIELLEIVK